MRRFVPRRFVPWLFLAPALCAFAWFKFVPMLKGLELSFYKVNFAREHEWVGLANFMRAAGDGALHAAALNTTLYVVVTVLASALIGFLRALVLEGPARHLAFIRTAMFLPAVTSAAILAEVWRILFFPTGDGVVNAMLGLAGVGAQGFLADPRQALGTLMLLHIWKAVPYDTVIFVAGLATIDRELYDAAAVDGAGRLAVLRYVTFPSMLPTIAIVLMLGLIRGFRVFAEVYATTGGGPAGATEMIMTHIYKIGFDQFDYGYASAVSFLLFILTVALTVLYLVWQRRLAR